MSDICGMKYEEYIKLLTEFHGTVAPGLIIGGYMVDLAYKKLPKGGLYDVVCESVKCLPDAVQLFTPCTIGNGWLKIEKIGRFAMTFYDKYTGEGIRLYLDNEKLKDYPPVQEWFFRTKPKHDQDPDALLRSIKEAGSSIISVQKVLVEIKKDNKEKHTIASVCPVCGESYPFREGKDMCKVCSGEIKYYSKI
jgi:formylmethanofuran dehydrogenase subunit E